MRTLKMNLSLALIAMTLVSGMYAQEQTPMAFRIHDVDVKLGMNSEYESACNELTSQMKKFNVQDFNFMVVQTLDNRYLWVGPLENMAQLDKNVFKSTAESIGEDKLGELIGRAYDCYSSGHDYVINLRTDLSYQPGGINQNPEGQGYRKFHYFHYAPSNSAKVMEKAKEIQAMFAKAGSKLEYRSYQSGFGVDGEFLMVAIAAKDAADYNRKIAENNELLGEEWAKLYQSFMATLEDYEIIEGNMRPDMGYSPTSM